MTKTEVIDLLEEKHQLLYDWLKDHPDQKWPEGLEGKWNTGEHVVHLIQSESALNKGLGFPKFVLKYKFGTNNRDNRTYDQIVEKYQNKLVEYSGVVADISKNMPEITSANKASYIAKLDQEKTKLIRKFQKWSDKDLDTYLLPHPLMGRMTIREIVIWTAYHTEHHCKILESKY
ncbi:MAG: DinB family protein [Bacteroidota bacterium]